MFKIITVRELHTDFAAEVSGVDFSHPIADEVCSEIKQALHQFGVLVFRNTGLDDESQVNFAAHFGPLDSMKLPSSAGIKLRISSSELTDQSNMDVDGTILDSAGLRGQFNKGNLLFHVDNSYNHQRAIYSILRAADIPSDIADRGGCTEFAETRLAYDNLPEEWKKELLEKDYDVWHSIWHSRKLGSPEFFDRVNPGKYPMAERKLVQLHEPSGRLNLCVPAHCHHIEGLDAEDSRKKLDFLFAHATQQKFVVSVAWQNPGDVTMWDNRAVMHRGTPMVGGLYIRDMRRATVLDEGPGAFSSNQMDPVESWKAMYDVSQLYGVKIGA